MFRRHARVEEPVTNADILRALRPVLIHIGLKLAVMYAFRAAIRHSLKQMDTEGRS